jgi:hypothetical protein
LADSGAPIGPVRPTVVASAGNISVKSAQAAQTHPLVLSPKGEKNYRGIYATAAPDHPLHIAWREPTFPGAPADWREFCFPVKDQLDAGLKLDAPRHPSLPVNEWNGDHFGHFFAALAPNNSAIPAMIRQDGTVAPRLSPGWRGSGWRRSG